MNQTDSFEAERPRLVRIASRVLGDHAAVQDVVQQAWLRLHGTDAEIDSLPAWLTTVTTRLCLDRLRSRTRVPPRQIEGRDEVAAFFNGSAKAALPVFVGDRRYRLVPPRRGQGRLRLHRERRPRSRHHPPPARLAWSHSARLDSQHIRHHK
jgi:hypothetical protein